MFLCLSGPGDNVPRDIRAMRCEIDIKKVAYASAEGGGPLRPSLDPPLQSSLS